MPRSPIPVAGTSKTGSVMPAPQTTDPVNGNSVANSDGQTLLIVANTGSVTRALTIRLTATVDGLPVNPRVIPVPAGQQLLLGVYPYWWYGMTLQLDPEHTDLRISALRPGQPVPATALPGIFTVSGTVVIADLTAAGLTTAGTVLLVDTVLTSSTVSGNGLAVTT